MPSKAQPLTLVEAKALKYNQTLYHMTHRDSRGHAQRWRVTSVKVWKRSPERVLVGLKHGLYSYDKADETTINLLSLTDPTM